MLSYAHSSHVQNYVELLGAGHGPARISNNGRFITYTAGFDHSNIRGTHEKPQILTADNLFLYDTFLGLTWQITKEGDVGVDLESRIESFCCSSASSSYQRGVCSKKREMTGFCCWQRTCWFPAQWPVSYFIYIIGCLMLTISNTCRAYLVMVHLLHTFQHMG